MTNTRSALRLTVTFLSAQPALQAEDERVESQEIRDVKAGEQADLFTIAGVPQHSYSFDVEYEHGEIVPLRALGTVGFVIRPKGPVHPQRRWLWISNLFL